MSDRTEPSSVRLPLPGLAPGQCAVVCDVRPGTANDATGEDVDRLKAMGICRGREVMLVRSGDPLIVRVLGSRIGISARLAARVEVEVRA